MAKNHNPGIVNLPAATKSILSDGGGKSSRPNKDGSTHVTVYSTKQNQHLSYDVDKSGKVSNVHTDKNNRAFYDYKGGKN